MRMNSGISFRHGAHHVAQKFTTITLPFQSDSFAFLPSRPASAVSITAAGGAVTVVLTRSSEPRK